MASKKSGVGFWVARIAWFLFLGASFGSAQVPTAAVSGRVLDSSGAAIPSANVTVTSQETGRVQTTQTSAGGYYKVVVPVGVYNVRVEVISFRPETRQGLNLSVGQEAVLNFSLQVGSVAESVTVTAEAPLVDTTSGSLGGLVNEQKVSELPLNGRNFNDLVLLQPGIGISKPVSTTSTASKGLFFSSNGASVTSNYMMLDGANLMNVTGLNGVSASGSMLGVEGIREFRVITNFAQAEYGMVMGGQVVVVTKNGTNNFHGSLFEFLRNSAFDARNHFDRKRNETDPRIPDFRRNNFGGSAGGPIQRDKQFFFVTYEGVRESLGDTKTLNTINAQARQDGFLVPRIAESVKPYLALFPLPTEPLPNDPTGAQGAGRFVYVFKQPTREDYGSARWDYNFSEKDTMFIRYTIDDTIQTKSPNFPQYSDSYKTRGQYMT
ncbi:MAG: carboxypeptidase-like regulatory domain-containing protein, partial [Terriglobia bacterium]